VAAFEILAQELSAYGAPAQLIAAARAAACDEVQHAAAMATLARRFGAVPQAPSVTRSVRRSLEQIALENAVEGCVHETFGAAVGSYQAQAANDPEIGAIMRDIAVYETRHAALSWLVDAWIMPRLSPAARARVAQARAAAVLDLRQSLERAPAAELRALAGLPDLAQARRLFAVVSEALWPELAAA
jgi:hypothetical protein